MLGQNEGACLSLFIANNRCVGVLVKPDHYLNYIIKKEKKKEVSETGSHYEIASFDER